MYVFERLSAACDRTVMWKRVAKPRVAITLCAANTISAVNSSASANICIIVSDFSGIILNVHMYLKKCIKY